MNSINYASRLIKSIVVFGFLVYVLINNTQPFWLLFVISFLIMTFINILENLFMLLKKRDIALKIHKLFVITFVVFIFAFMSVWCYIAISQKQYGLLIPALPFVIIGALLVRNKVFKNNKPILKFDVNIKLIMGAALVGVCFLSGIMVLLISLNPLNIELLLFGLFFIFGSLVFVLAYMQMKGCFDHLSIDIVGLFAGIVITLVGAGSLFIIWNQNKLFDAKLWIVIPVLMILVGIIQIVKKLKRK